MKRMVWIYLVFSMFMLGSAFADIESDLVSHYPLDGNGTDWGPHSAHAQTSGRPQSVSDRHGNPGSAFLFDGDDDYLFAGNAASFSGPFSIAVWIKPELVKTQSIVRLGGGNDATYHLATSATGDVIAQLGLTSGILDCRYSGYNTGQWYHLAAVYDGSELKLYSDGGLKRSCSANGTLVSETQLLIGSKTGLGKQNWQGALDEVRIYSRALTDTEIGELMAYEGLGSSDSADEYVCSTETPESCSTQVECLANNGVWHSNYSVCSRQVDDGTVTPTPTATPIATPVPTTTPAPTAAPVPTATPAPTATPVPTATPAPTATPMPTATPTPTPGSDSEQNSENSDIVSDGGQCVTVSPDLDLSIPCLEFNNHFYSFELGHFNHPGDPSKLYWTLNSKRGYGAYNRFCATTDEALNVLIPCLQFGDKYMNVTLNRYAPTGSSGYYWTLGDYRSYVEAPKLVSMQATDSDTLELNWIPGTDNITPANQVNYRIFLSTEKDFTADISNQKAVVVGQTSLELSDLDSDKLYYAKIIADYTNLSSEASNELSAKTYQYTPLVDSNVSYLETAKAGLGHHTTEDGSTYIYSQGTAPEVGSLIFSEDKDGSMTLRRVDSVEQSGNSISVSTSAASLNQLLPRGEIQSSMLLSDLDTDSQNRRAKVGGYGSTIQTQSRLLKDNSEFRRMEWQDAKLSIEQTYYAHNRDGLEVTPNGNGSVVRMFNPKAAKRAVYEEEFKYGTFIAELTTSFDPEVSVQAKWGGIVLKELESGEISAKGTLNLKALAHYNFSTEDTFEKTFDFYEKKIEKVFVVGYIPVKVKVKLIVQAKLEAKAEIELDAQAEANLSEMIEIRATYDQDNGWTSHIRTDESQDFKASLSIKGQVEADIRLVPKVEVAIYESATSELSIEPFLSGSVAVKNTTNNPDFIRAHPLRVMMLSGFDASLGLESNVEANLYVLGENWELLPKTCILGTKEGCDTKFNGIALFSLPKLERLTIQRHNDQGQYAVILNATDGTNNPLYTDTIQFEAFPNDAEVDFDLSDCIKNGSSTTCQAILTPAGQDQYTVFASGNGRLGSVARQYMQATVTVNGDGVSNDPVTVTNDCGSENLSACDGPDNCANAGGYWNFNDSACEVVQPTSGSGPGVTVETDDSSNPGTSSVDPCQGFNEFKASFQATDCSFHEGFDDRMGQCISLNSCYRGVNCSGSAADAYIAWDQCLIDNLSTGSTIW